MGIGYSIQIYGHCADALVSSTKHSDSDYTTWMLVCSRVCKGG